MRLLKNCQSFFARHVLRFRHGRDGEGQVSDSSGREDEAGVTSVRTYAAGGDPFDDRIEFHLVGRSDTAGGFRDPRE